MKTHLSFTEEKPRLLWQLLQNTKIKNLNIKGVNTNQVNNRCNNKIIINNDELFVM